MSRASFLPGSNPACRLHACVFPFFFSCIERRVSITLYTINYHIFNYQTTLWITTFASFINRITNTVFVLYLPPEIINKIKEASLPYRVKEAAIQRGTVRSVVFFFFYILSEGGTHGISPLSDFRRLARSTRENSVCTEREYRGWNFRQFYIAWTAERNNRFYVCPYKEALFRGCYNFQNRAMSHQNFVTCIGLKKKMFLKIQRNFIVLHTLQSGVCFGHTYTHVQIFAFDVALQVTDSSVPWKPRPRRNSIYLPNARAAMYLPWHRALVNF